MEKKFYWTTKKISLEHYLKPLTSIFKTYQKKNKGKQLTIDTIGNRLVEYHDIGIGGATPAPTVTNDDGAVAA